MNRKLILVIVTMLLVVSGALSAAAQVARPVEGTPQALCSVPPSSTKVCVGNVVCIKTAAAPPGGADVIFQPAGGCPAGYVSFTIPDVSHACTAASIMVPDPGRCPECCNDLGVGGPSTSNDATCCTATKTRSCSPKAKEVEPLEPLHLN